MAFSQADVDGLKATMAKGVLRYRYEDGREVTYQSLDEMRRTLTIMEAEVAASSPTGYRKRGHSVAGF